MSYEDFSCECMPEMHPGATTTRQTMQANGFGHPCRWTFRTGKDRSFVKSGMDGLLLHRGGKSYASAKAGGKIIRKSLEATDHMVHMGENPDRHRGWRIAHNGRGGGQVIHRRIAGAGAGIAAIGLAEARRCCWNAPVVSERLRSMLVVVALAVGVGAGALSGLARVPLFQPIEGLNSNVAQSMIATGDWWVPRHNGCIYADKPPLFYWVTAGGLKVFGETEFGARFGLALVGLTEVLLVYFLGRLLYGRTAGLLSAAVLATSVGHMIFTRLMMVDATFSACLTATLLCFALGYVRERQRLWWWTLAGMAAGLAVLAKSLIGTVFPVLTIGGFIILTRQWRLLEWRAMAGAVPGFLAVALPWHIYMLAQVPGFAYCHFWNEQVMRFLNRREPLDFVGSPLPVFLVSVLVWALPWSLTLPHIAWSFWRRKPGDSPSELLARHLPWLWLGSVIGFFALTRGRLFYYSLPTLPAFALLTGWFWSGIARRDGKRFRLTMAMMMILVALGTAPAILMVPQLGGQAVPEDVNRQMLPHIAGIGGCLALGSVVGGVAILLRRYRTAFVALTGAMLASVIPLSDTLRAFGGYVSLGPLVGTVRSALGPDDLVVHRFVRDDNSELPFYLHHKVRILKRPGEFHQPILGDADGYYIEQDEFDKLWVSDKPVFLMVSHPLFVGMAPEPPPPGATILARHLDAFICCNPAATRLSLAARKVPFVGGRPGRGGEGADGERTD